MNSTECVQETGIRCWSRDKGFREKLNAFLSPFGNIAREKEERLENNCREEFFCRERERRDERILETFDEIKSYHSL